MTDATTAPVTPYELHQLRCRSGAERWEEAAEKARRAGDLYLAGQCTQHSVRLRWLAEEDPEVEDLFNGTGRWAGNGRGYVSDEDEEKFDRLLTDPFGRDGR